jgi:WD40 repeat protein
MSTGHTNSVFTVDWARGDMRLISGSADRTVQVWHLNG